MLKTLKTFLAVAVSFSIVTISSAFAGGHSMLQSRNGLMENLVFQLYLQKRERKN